MLASGQTCRGACSIAVPVHGRRRPFVASNARPRLTACAAQEGLLDTSTSSAAIPCCSSSSSSSATSGSHAWAPSLAVPETQAETSAAPAQSYTPPAGRHGVYDSAGKLLLKSLTLKELEEWCATLGEGPKRAMQLWRWMYADRNWIRSLQDTLGVQNGFSQKFIDLASASATVDGGLERQQVMRAKDGTRKIEFKLTQGDAAGRSIETVLIPVVREGGQRNRITICVSTQVGCAMNCQFCYTGRMGLLGHLSTAQIIEQVVEAKRLMQEEGDSTPVTNIVFMGMGEPLHNMEAVCTSIDIMSCYLGLHLSYNKITVSTVGLVPEIRQFKSRSRAQLAVSLHATTDEVRDWIVPLNRRYNLKSLMGCLAELYPREGDITVLIEYIMLRNINDTIEDAQRLVQMLEPINCKANLILFNPHAGTKFVSSEDEQMLAFRSVLIQAGRVCTIRDSRGDDEMAACGQLGNPGLSHKSAPILEPPPRFKKLLGV